MMNNRNFIYKLAAIVFMILLLTPCTIKSNIKLSLNVSTSIANKDRVTVSSCSTFSTSSQEIDTTDRSLALAKKLDYSNDKQFTPLQCTKTQELEKKKVEDKASFYTTPIFIHHRVLII